MKVVCDKSPTPHHLDTSESPCVNPVKVEAEHCPDCTDETTEPIRCRECQEEILDDEPLVEQESQSYHRECVGSSSDVPQLIAEVERLRLALAFYAAPDTYHAIGFFPDAPCGGFMDDFSEHGHPDYAPDDVRPGKLAREVLGFTPIETPLEALEALEPGKVTP